MATYTKRGTRWRVEVRRKGEASRSKTFATKAAARAWAEMTERDIDLGSTIAPDKTFRDLLVRYEQEVSVHKRGHQREAKALHRLQGDPVADVSLRELSTQDIAAWRDRRLRSVSGSSVNREMNIISHVCSVAVQEWGWLLSSPTSGVRRPKSNPPRERRPSDDEVERILIALGYSRDDPPVRKSARVGAAFLFAIETAMRAGEIAGIRSDQIFEKHVHLDKTKNGSTRDVPLSTEAKRLLAQVRDVCGDEVFGLTAPSIDAIFRKYRNASGVVGLHFHDSRREALTRLAKKFGVMELAKISGHRDLRILQNVYYNPTVGDLADKMD